MCAHRHHHYWMGIRMLLLRNLPLYPEDLQGSHYRLESIANPVVENINLDLQWGEWMLNRLLRYCILQVLRQQPIRLRPILRGDFDGQHSARQ